MKCYPASATQQLEFDKILELLAQQCMYARNATKVANMRLHTNFSILQKELLQTNEFLYLLNTAAYFPLQQVHVVETDIKLLGISGAMLVGEQWLNIVKFCSTIHSIFKWFDDERQEQFTTLYAILHDSYYEPTIVPAIQAVIDDSGAVLDNASPELAAIRMSLYRKRAELRRVFDRMVSKWSKAGYVTDIEESFLNNRRVVAVYAEHKRQIKGILHGESDTRRTAFVEPEETIELNNDIFSLELDERKEVNRILLALTASLQPYAQLLQQHFFICCQFDFVRAKARLAQTMGACMPTLVDKSIVDVKKAFHPLLLHYNMQVKKSTIPLTLQLNDGERLLVISGPNAGGKTVAMKTIGLLQLMWQSGMLVPVEASSTMGIFKQLMIHIGDTQDLASELSTYSSHLINMKHFVENANGRTLFFVDELGGGSDPQLGGAFAEVILDELLKRHSIGIVTTHYLNLKVMASQAAGMLNGSMLFDEATLSPLYKLQVGKPGSSYTFAIAQRIGLPAHLIDKAKSIAKTEQYQLDHLLNSAEQNEQLTAQRSSELKQLLLEQERLNAELKVKLNKEKHRQEVEKLKYNNQQTAQQLNELRTKEKQLKQAVQEWKRTKNKGEAIANMENLLFEKRAMRKEAGLEKKFLERYFVIGGQVAIGDLVRMKSTNQVSKVKEILSNGKATIQFGLLPVNVDITDLEVIGERVTE